MDYILISLASIQILILFLNVKGSLQKVYTIAGQTRAVFDFICISTLFLVLSIFVKFGLELLPLLLLVFIASFILFWFDIKIHNREGFAGVILSIFSSLFVAIFSGLFYSNSVFTIPAVGTLAFYLILSLWNIRFSGKIRLTDYILPFLYSILALILILNI